MFPARAPVLAVWRIRNGARNGAESAPLNVLQRGAKSASELVSKSDAGRPRWRWPKWRRIKALGAARRRNPGHASGRAGNRPVAGALRAVSPCRRWWRRWSWRARGTRPAGRTCASEHPAHPACATVRCRRRRAGIRPGVPVPEQRAHRSAGGVASRHPGNRGRLCSRPEPLAPGASVPGARASRRHPARGCAASSAPV